MAWIDEGYSGWQPPKKPPVDTARNWLQNVWTDLTARDGDVSSTGGIVGPGPGLAQSWSDFEARYRQKVAQNDEDFRREMQEAFQTGRMPSLKYAPQFMALAGIDAGVGFGKLGKAGAKVPKKVTAPEPAVKPPVSEPVRAATESAAAKGAVEPAVPAGQARALPPTTTPETAGAVTPPAAPAAQVPVTPTAQNVPPAGTSGSGGTTPPRMPKSGTQPQPVDIPDWMQQEYKLATEMYDRIYPLAKLQEKSGVRVHDVGQVVPGAAAAGEDVVRRFYQPVLRNVGGNEVKTLEQYMVLSRSRDLLASGRAKIVPGGYKTVAEVDAALSQLAGQNTKNWAKLTQAADQLWQANTAHVIDRLEAEGILSAKGAAALRQQGAHYIDFHRADYVLDGVGEQFGARAGEASVGGTGIKRLSEEGSARALDNPLGRFVAQPVKAEMLIARNKAGKALEEAIKAVDPALARRLKPNQQFSSNVDWGVISFYENGQKVRVKVPRIYEVVAKSEDAQHTNALVQVFRAMSRPLVSGATKYNPAFALIVNPIMDASSAFFRTGLKPFSKDWIQGWVASITKNANFTGAAQDGALMSGIVESLTKPETMAGKAAFGSIPVRNAKDVALFIPRLIAEGAQTSERATRIAVYLRQKRLGDPGLQAAIAARDATVDFSKAGNTARLMNQALPFFNAGIQGSANVARLIRQNPKWAAIASAPFAAMTFAAWTNNQQYDTADMISESEYGRSWVFIIGEGTKADGTKYPIRIKIPKGPLGAVVTLPFEAGLMFARSKGDPSGGDMGLMLSTVLTAASPVELDPFGVVPPALATAGQVAANYDAYRNSPIVPRGEQSRLPEMQYGPETPRWAVAAGQFTQTSPRKWDFAARDFLAGGGQLVGYGADKALGAAGYNPVPYGQAQEAPLTSTEELSRAPVVSRILGTSSGARESRDWRSFDKAVEDSQRALYKAFPEMNRLGVSFSAVGDSRENITLTTRERAMYQSKTLEAAEPLLIRMRLTPQYIRASDAQKKEMLQRTLTEARERAWVGMKMLIGPAEVQRRRAEEAKQKISALPPKERTNLLLQSPAYQSMPYTQRRDTLQQLVRLG